MVMMGGIELPFDFGKDNMQGNFEVSKPACILIMFGDEVLSFLIFSYL